MVTTPPRHPDRGAKLTGPAASTRAATWRHYARVLTGAVVRVVRIRVTHTERAVDEVARTCLDRFCSDDDTEESCAPDESCDRE